MTAPERVKNPDTGLLLPTPSTEQEQLVDEVLQGIGQSTDPANVVRRAMIEAVVRQHGRTLRSALAHISEAHEHLDRAAEAIDAARNVRVGYRS